jgi:hypothetical protein
VTILIASFCRGAKVVNCKVKGGVVLLHWSEDVPRALEIRAVSQLLWPDKDREVWFSLVENHEKGRSLPGFPAARH